MPRIELFKARLDYAHRGEELHQLQTEFQACRVVFSVNEEHLYSRWDTGEGP